MPIFSRFLFFLFLILGINYSFTNEEETNKNYLEIICKEIQKLGKNEIKPKLIKKILLISHEIYAYAEGKGYDDVVEFVENTLKIKLLHSILKNNCQLEELNKDKKVGNSSC